MAAYPDETGRTKTKNHETSEPKTCRSRHHGTRKKITFPMDAKLYNKARQQLTQVAKEQNITLRQYDKAFHELMPYGHVKHYKWMIKALKHLGRVLRDIDRQLKQKRVNAHPETGRHTQPSLSITKINSPEQK